MRREHRPPPLRLVRGAHRRHPLGGPLEAALPETRFHAICLHFLRRKILVRFARFGFTSKAEKKLVLYIRTLILGRISKAMFGPRVAGRRTQEKVLRCEQNVS